MSALNDFLKEMDNGRWNVVDEADKAWETEADGCQRELQYNAVWESALKHAAEELHENDPDDKRLTAALERLLGIYNDLLFPGTLDHPTDNIKTAERALIREGDTEATGIVQKAIVWAWNEEGRPGDASNISSVISWWDELAADIEPAHNPPTQSTD